MVRNLFLILKILMKKFFLIYAFIFLTMFSGNGQITAYQPGEKVEYIIHYGLITGRRGYS